MRLTVLFFALFISCGHALEQWETLTLDFLGPQTSEQAKVNPFTDYRLDVTFTHEQKSVQIRGFYAADGRPAETSARAGKVWQARFTPPLLGEWRYEAALRIGEQIAISNDPNAGEHLPLTNASGTFTVTSSTETAPSFRARGRLVADQGYFRFEESGHYWLKGGTDSPENLLGYSDFDGTFRIKAEARDGEATTSEALHTYTPHLQDWKPGDPTWKDGLGKGLIGGLNYLASEGMNAAYFLTMNILGDGKDVWPYAAPDDFTRFDCSKLDQWEIVFQHMQSKGILMHVVTQETENERMLDDGDTGPLRKLYYRELIARFGHHLGLVWNLGEENGPAEFSPNGQTTEQRKAMASYLKANDPYGHPVVLHTHSTKHHKEEILTDLLGFEALDGLSFQVDKRDRVPSEVIEWRAKAREAGHEWLICMDEIGMWHTGALPDAEDPNHDTLRRHALWGSLLAGSAGVEWYFGAKHPHNDLTLEDWRTRANLWAQTRHALNFFEEHLPYWKMQPRNDLISDEDARCFTVEGEVYAIHVPKESLPIHVDFPSVGALFTVRWFDPVEGGPLQIGSDSTMEGGGVRNIGKPPHDRAKDWVILIKL